MMTAVARHSGVWIITSSPSSRSNHCSTGLGLLDTLDATHGVEK